MHGGKYPHGTQQEWQHYVFEAIKHYVTKNLKEPPREIVQCINGDNHLAIVIRELDGKTGAVVITVTK